MKVCKISGLSNFIMRYKSYLIGTPMIFLLIVNVVGCKPTFHNEEELSKYILEEKNGLVKTYEENGYKVQVFLKPTDLLIAQEYKNTSAIDIQDSQILENKYINYLYFVLSISKNNKEVLIPGSNNFNDLLQTMSFRMDNIVNLTTSEKDKIPVADFLHSRTFGISQSTNILFVFSAEDIEADKWIQFNLNEFGLSLGDLSFRFETKDINNVQKLILR